MSLSWPPLPSRHLVSFIIDLTGTGRLIPVVFTRLGWGIDTTRGNQYGEESRLSMWKVRTSCVRYLLHASNSEYVVPSGQLEI
jgi:hypothetical protein